MVNRVLVIDAPVELQRDRVKQRNGYSDSQIDAIMRQQASRQQRLAHADDVIVNDGPLAQIATDVLNLHQKYQQLSGEQ